MKPKSSSTPPSQPIRSQTSMLHPPPGASKQEMKVFYVSEIGLFVPTLAVNDETPSGDVIMFHGFRVFRNVRLFIQQVKRVGARDGISLCWVLEFCLQGGALRWFNNLTSNEAESLRSGPLKPFYDQLMSQFDEVTRIEEARIAKQQAAEEARIAKEKAEAFACRRCPEKFASNTKLHDHVREKHAKKPKEAFSNENAPPATPTPAALPTPPTSPALPLATPTPVAIPSPIASPTSPPTSPITSHATIPTTPKNSISWSEIASRPKSTSAPSRLPRLTIKCGLPTPPPSPILSPILETSESANHIAKRPSITPSFATPMKSCLSVQDLYTKFHGKSRPLSFPTMQNRLPSAPPSGHQIRLRQMHITSYFKSTSNGPTCPASPPKAELVPNRKHTHLKVNGQMAWIRDLASSKPRHSALHTCRRCTQQFISGNMLHRHLRHCSRCTKRWPNANNPTLAGNLIGGRYPSLY